MTLPRKAGNPWYREPWPWILFGLPGIVVIAGVATLLIAVYSEDGVVDQDYYREGLGINKQLARVDAAVARGLTGRVFVEQGTARVSLASTKGATLPERLTLKVTHPTRAGADQEVALTRAGDVYVGVLHPLPAGRWRFHLEDAAGQWRLDAETTLPARDGVVLDPKAYSAGDV
ncbi:FixH family protein [Niveibacterium sp. SC-1]|uniref:FixH family protein n=1 Tax=Niveibacterium sp. SC-1 TaxID=3135646 RepID=UPI00311E992D